MWPVASEMCIRDRGKHHTVILSSHILSEVSAVCDFVMIISRGELAVSYTHLDVYKRQGNRCTGTVWNI